MTRFCWWLVDIVSGLLQPHEREAVRGDLIESGETGAQALRDVLGLLLRRQAANSHDWRPWLALLGVAVPLGFVLSLLSRHMAHGSSIYLWLCVDNGEWAYLRNAGFRHDVAHYSAIFLRDYVSLFCWSWTTGLLLGSLSRRTIPVNGALFGLVVLCAKFLPSHRYLVAGARDGNAAVFASTFYAVIFPWIVQAVLVLLPSLWGMYRSLRLATLPRVLQAIVWGAAIATIAALAMENSHWSRFLGALTLPLQSLALLGPLTYMAVTAIGRRRRGGLLQENNT